MQIPIFRGGCCMKKVKLGELVSIQTGKLDANAAVVGGKYPFFTTAKEISWINDYVYDDEVVLVAGNGDLNVKYYKGKFNAYQRTYILSNNSNVRMKYLYYFLDKYIKVLRHQSIGGVIKYIKLNNLSNAQVPMMSIPEQEKIIKNLEKIDYLISKKSQQYTELSKLVKSRFNEMFGDPVFNEMRWRRCKLKDISIGKLAYGSGASAIDFSGLRYIRITDIDECGNLKLDKKSPSHYDEKYLLNTGDILFARSGATVGKTFLYSKEKYGPALYAGYLIRLIPNLSLVNPVFVYHFTNTKFYNDFIAKVQNTVAQPNINAKQYSELDFILPPLSLQNEFADFVAQVDKSQFACGIVIKLWRNNLKSSII